MLVADKPAATVEEFFIALNARVDEVVVEYNALRAERDAALAEAAKYKALWESVPWKDLRTVHWHMPIGAPVQPFKRVDVWMKNNGPQPQGEEKANER